MGDFGENSDDCVTNKVSLLIVFFHNYLIVDQILDFDVLLNS